MGILTGSVPADRPDPTLAQAPQASPRLVPVTDGGPSAVPVFVTNGVRTSDGPGPGHKRLPPQEANWLISMKYAVAGD
jgi:hypothetical protein